MPTPTATTKPKSGPKAPNNPKAPKAPKSPGKAPKASTKAPKMSADVIESYDVPAPEPTPEPAANGAAVKARPTARRTVGEAARHREVAALLRLAADPTRIAVLMLLARVESMSVTAIVDTLGGSQPAISHHLAIMRHSGMLDPTRDGKFNFYAATPAGRRLATAVKSLVD